LYPPGSSSELEDEIRSAAVSASEAEEFESGNQDSVSSEGDYKADAKVVEATIA
jgi:hypothetical protein